MPPYFAWISDWLEMIFEIIFVPSSTTDADVSSQEVSIPRISIDYYKGSLFRESNERTGPRRDADFSDFSAVPGKLVDDAFKKRRDNGEV